jgi:hypothetical protein
MRSVQTSKNRGRMRNRPWHRKNDRRESNHLGGGETRVPLGVSVWVSFNGFPPSTGGALRPRLISLSPYFSIHLFANSPTGSASLFGPVSRTTETLPIPPKLGLLRFAFGPRNLNNRRPPTASPSKDFYSHSHSNRRSGGRPSSEAPTPDRCENARGRSRRADGTQAPTSRGITNPLGFRCRFE